MIIVEGKITSYSRINTTYEMVPLENDPKIYKLVLDQFIYLGSFPRGGGGRGVNLIQIYAADLLCDFDHFPQSVADESLTLFVLISFRLPVNGTQMLPYSFWNTVQTPTSPMPLAGALYM